MLCPLSRFFSLLHLGRSSGFLCFSWLPVWRVQAVILWTPVRGRGELPHAAQVMPSGRARPQRCGSSSTADLGTRPAPGPALLTWIVRLRSVCQACPQWSSYLCFVCHRSLVRDPLSGANTWPLLWISRSWYSAVDDSCWNQLVPCCLPGAGALIPPSLLHRDS